MPALPRPSRAVTITLPPRQAIARRRRPTCWWSAAGRPASARRSARPRPAREVILAERYGFLGGNATAALVMPLMSFHTQRADARSGRAPPSCSRPTTGRASRWWPARWPSCSSGWSRAGGAIPPSLATGYVVPFDPELFKLVALELLDEAGVQLLFHAFASGVDRRRPGATASCSRPSPGRSSSAPGWWSTAPATATSRRGPARPTRSAATRTGWCSR